MKKLSFWKRKISENGFEDEECFPLLHRCLTFNELEFSEDIKSIFEEHLSELNICFEKYLGLKTSSIPLLQMNLQQ